MTEQEAMDAAYRASPITPKSMWHHWQIAWQAALQWAAEGQEPVAWADDAAMAGGIGNCASASAKRYWERSHQIDRGSALRLSHPLYAVPVPNADLLAEVERLRKALEQVIDGASDAHPSEFALCLARVDGIARAALAKGE